MNKLKMCSALIILLFLWNQDLVESLRILELRVPGHVEEGGQALLGCQFDLENDELYSVKWYKDDREFYRYVPTNSEPSFYFSAPGVLVDVSRSSSSVVALEHLTKESAGRYRCEVSGEAPYFVTVSDEKYVTIDLLPTHSPRMTEVEHEYEVGEHLRVNCTSSRSRPSTQITWLINSQSASENYLRGPWEWISRERTDASVTALELSFVLKDHHFRDGVLTIECQAVLAPLYQDKVVRHILRIDHKAHTEQISNTTPLVYEASILSASSVLIEAESQNDEYFKDSKAATKSTAFILPSIFILQILLYV